MTTWNYRVMRREHPPLPNQVEQITEVTYAIHEVFSDADGKVESWTQDSVSAFEDTPEGVKWGLSKMLEATDRPVLDYETGKERPCDLQDDITG